MKIECTPQELKELINKNKPVVITTNVKPNEKQLERINKYLANDNLVAL